MTDPEQRSTSSILVVDDDEMFRMVLARALRTRGYDASVAGNYDEAIDRVLADPPQFAMVDLRMPGRSGLDLLESIKRMHPATILLVLTADRSPATMAEAKCRGASAYLTKPADVDEIISSLNALDKGRIDNGGV